MPHVIELLTDPQVWITLITLSAIEIVLGIDNLVFISIAVSKLPYESREKARKFGIAVACISRIALLLTLAWLAGLTNDLFTVFGQGISVRDLVLILGGAFLLVKGSMEVKDLIVGEDESEDVHTKPAASFMAVIAQIAVIDIVFSLDSVIAAVGMANHTPVMVAAILLAVAVMLLASKPLGYFIDHNPTIKMLALAFIVLVGVYLIADGLEVHIPKGYIYGAMGFSALVECLNLWAKKRANRRLSAE
ncbi:MULTISPECIES: TerC family protein [Lysobacter]|uniref:TerC family protein n=1 Tax=Lysobacter TaxID=68 RepID=UPI0004D00A93|nr:MULTISPECIES: TerC family protein [Lysobacter]